MLIRTKYSIGDKRWFIKKDSAVCAPITGIRVAVETNDGTLNDTVVNYQLDGCYRSAAYIDTKTFASKEELLNSL